jgi:tight adherence protein B
MLPNPAVVLWLAAALGATYGFLGLKAARARRVSNREVAAWPAFVEAFASALSSGLSRVEAIELAIDRAPKALAAKLRGFEHELRKARLIDALNGIKPTFANSFVDEFVEVVALSERLGGAGLVGLLQSHSVRCREAIAAEEQVRAKVAATLTVAKLAVGAPWVLLCLLLTRPESAESFNSSTGLVVLLSGLAVCIVAYRAISMIGRTPEDSRVYA